MKRLLVAVGAVALAVFAAVAPFEETTQAQEGCFTQSGFCITNPAFRQYFDARGGVSTFGYPISREFAFLGFRVQFFQGHIMQLQPNGAVATMNLLSEGLMPVTRVNGSTFPAEDPDLVNGAPPTSEANYADRVVEFIRQNAPNEYNNQPVNFFNTFVSTVDLATAFPGGGGNPALLPLLNLEIWGVVTSRPAADPANGGFIYQRYQRSIMHYRDVCRCTERILLANWFKTVITGDGLPSDLAEDMAGSPFIYQWNPDGERGMNRPDQLPTTDLTNAFRPDLPGFPTPGAATGQPGPTTTPTPEPGEEAGPNLELQLSDDSVRAGRSVTITLIADDERGVEWLRWEGEPRDDDDPDDVELSREREYDCDDRRQCANVWEVTPTVAGRYTIFARARSSDGRRSEVTRELRVRESEATETPTPTPAVTETPTPAATATATPTATATATATPAP